jgi:hypothetical protein
MASAPSMLTKGQSSKRLSSGDPFKRAIEDRTIVKRSDKDITKFDKDAASSDVNYFQGSNLSLRAINVVNGGQLEEVGVYIRTEFGGGIKYTFTQGIYELSHNRRVSHGNNFSPGNPQPRLITLYNQRGVALPSSSSPLILPDGTKISYDPASFRLVVVRVNISHSYFYLLRRRLAMPS